MRRTTFEDWAREQRDGVACLADARRQGASDRSWRRWKELWTPIPGVRGVFFLDHRPRPEARLRAAVIAVPGAVLAGRSALWAHGLAERPWPLQVVTSHDVRCRDHPSVAVRRSRTLLPQDAVDVGGWPVSTVARAVLELAPALSDEALLALVIDLIRQGAMVVGDVVDRVAMTPTADGAPKLLRVVAALDGVRPDSVFEWEVRRALVAAGLAPSAGPVDVPTAGGSVSCDLVLADARVAIECDGVSHLEDVQADRDASKGNALADVGWQLYRVRHKPWRADPDHLVQQVARAVRSRSSAATTLGA